MIIKKFTAKTEEEATALAKAELGENVVIMNVRNADKRSFPWVVKRKQVEVTVAKEEENEKYAASVAVQGSAASAGGILNAAIAGTSSGASAFVTSGGGNLDLSDSQEADIRETFRQIAMAAEAIKDGGQTAAKPAAGSQSAKSAAGSKASAQSIAAAGKSGASAGNSAAAMQTSVIEEKLDSLQNMLEKQFVKPEEDGKSGDNSGDRTQEKSGSKESEKGKEMVRFMKLLFNTMVDNEVNEKYASQIIDEMEKNSKPGMPFDHALANVYQKMILRFEKADPISPAQKGPKVIFFIGPTGVGKTTTIAKIASLFSVNERKKVALLTADTYRIAAAEQLRTYANILEVPFRIIYSVEEMDLALRDFQMFDYILVDTAGHSHQNEAQKQNMASFIHSLDEKAEKEVHLVLSATTKYRDLLSIADAYRDMTDYKLIFTKLDETTTLGNLLNLKLYTGTSLSYITCGQNVPDDIEIFNPQKTVKKLLGGKH